VNPEPPRQAIGPTVRLLLLVAAAVCLAIALLLELGSISSGNAVAWRDGGLLAFVLSFVP
jgi:hypothetical protein